MSAKMVMEIEGIRFEKYPKGSTINIYIGSENVDCFTSYSVGYDFDRFEKSCKDYYNYMYNYMMEQLEE